MPVQTVSAFRVKAAVSVSAMAKAVGLSRSRFYDYVRSGVFPQPVYSVANRRPLYMTEQQQDILAVRQTGIGCNSHYVLFYERSPVQTPAPAVRHAARRESQSELIEGLRSLGLANVSPGQVDEALAVSFPSGTAGTESALILRTVYRHLRRLGAA